MRIIRVKLMVVYSGGGGGGDVDVQCGDSDGAVVGNVSAASLSSLTPAPALRQLASLLVEHRRLVLAGPSAVGKTSLAHTLAEFYVVNGGHEVTEEAIKVFR